MNFQAIDSAGTDKFPNSHHLRENTDPG